MRGLIKKYLIVSIALLICVMNLSQVSGDVTHHTFLDIINNKAWFGYSLSLPIYSNVSELTNSIFDAQAYEDIAYNDVNRTITNTIDSPTQSGYPYQLFRFYIEEQNITSIEVKWIGYGGQYWHDEYAADIYIMNFEAESWEKIGNYTSVNGDDVLISTNLTESSKYINTNHQLFILAYSSFGSGYSNSRLATNSAEVAVTNGVVTGVANIYLYLAFAVAGITVVIVILLIIILKKKKCRE